MTSLCGQGSIFCKDIGIPTNRPGITILVDESDMKIEHHVFMLDGENVFSWRLLQKDRSELISRRIYGFSQDFSSISGCSSANKVVFAVESTFGFGILLSFVILCGLCGKRF